jgi:hypothetical protein
VVGDQLHEAAVDLLHLRLERVALLRRQRPRGGLQAGVLAAGEHLAVHPDAAEKLGEVELPGEDADAAEDAPRAGPDLPGPEGDHVSPDAATRST